MDLKTSKIIILIQISDVVKYEPSIFFFFLNLCDSCIVYERVHAPLMHALISVRARFGEYLRSERRRERMRAHTRVAELSKKKSVGSYLMTPQISPKIKFSKCTEFIFFFTLVVEMV